METPDENGHEAGRGCSTSDLLGAIADLLECFGSLEGTWYQRDWRAYGISEDMEATMEKAWEGKYGCGKS